MLAGKYATGCSVVQHRLQRRIAGIRRVRLGLIRRECEHGMVVDEKAAGAAGGERERALELRVVRPVHRIGWRKRRDADRRRVEHDELRVDGARPERHGVRLAVIGECIVGRVVAGLPRFDRPRVEEAPPALAGARARLVVAARDDPRRRREQPLGRREKVGLPRVPAVAPRTARAPGVARRAGVFAIQIIADVEDEVRPEIGRGVSHRAERPRDRAVAILEPVVEDRQPASGVADHRDPLHVGLRQRQRTSADGGARHAGGNEFLAGQHRKG